MTVRTFTSCLLITLRATIVRWRECRGNIVIDVIDVMIHRQKLTLHLNGSALVVVETEMHMWAQHYAFCVMTQQKSVREHLRWHCCFKSHASSRRRVLVASPPILELIDPRWWGCSWFPRSFACWRRWSIVGLSKTAPIEIGTANSDGDFPSRSCSLSSFRMPSPGI